MVVLPVPETPISTRTMFTTPARNRFARTVDYLREYNCDMRGHRKSQLVLNAVTLRNSLRLKRDRFHERGTRRGIQLSKRRYRRGRPQHRELHKTLWRRQVNIERPGSNFHALKAGIA